jgi:putative oxidoreductase
MSFEDFNKYSTLSLRVGLSIVLFWFAFSQFTNATQWSGLVPSYTSFISATTVVYLNASLEVIMGTLLLFGLFTRVVAGIFTLHLIPIILTLGINSPSGIRDIGILFATLSLALSGSDYFSLDSIMKRRKK